MNAFEEYLKKIGPEKVIDVIKFLNPELVQRPIENWLKQRMNDEKLSACERLEYSKLLFRLKGI